MKVGNENHRRPEDRKETADNGALQLLRRVKHLRHGEAHLHSDDLAGDIERRHDHARGEAEKSPGDRLAADEKHHGRQVAASRGGREILGGDRRHRHRDGERCGEPDARR